MDMDNSWTGIPYKEFEFEGYHTEVSGNGYDLLIREGDVTVWENWKILH